MIKYRKCCFPQPLYPEKDIKKGYECKKKRRYYLKHNLYEVPEHEGNVDKTMNYSLL